MLRRIPYNFFNVNFKVFFVLSPILNRSSILHPATQQISPPDMSRGIFGLSERGILRSMKRFLSFFLPSIPRGMKLSPGRKERTRRGKAR